MDSRKIVFKETSIVAVGECICTAVMFAVFALLHRFDITVLLGGLVGTLLAVLNFFFMAVVASLAADRAVEQDVSGGQKLIKSAYPIRIGVLMVVLIACASSGWFHVLTLVLPLLFVRPTLTIAEFFQKKGA